MEQNRCISLLGSTGSIGRQSLDVIAACGMRVAALTANRDVEQMEKQCRRFQPELAVMMDPEAAASLRLRLADTPIRVAEGMEGLLGRPAWRRRTRCSPPWWGSWDSVPLWPPSGLVSASPWPTRRHWCAPGSW